MQNIFVIALFASLGTASLLDRTVSKECKKHPNSRVCEASYLDSVCAPGSQSKDVDLSAPCNMVQYIGVECVSGSKPNITRHGIADPEGASVSNSTQRLCVCESQYWKALVGCESCHNKHGGSGIPGLAYPDTFISSMSSAYCAASATPTLGFADFQFEYIQKPQFSSLFPAGSSSATTTVTFSDPLANSTAISLYYTAAVTGTDALNAGVFTATGTAQQTTTLVSDGQIVATAATNANTMATTTATTTRTTQGGTAKSSSTTSTSGIGSRQTEAAFAGVIGLIGVVALL